MRNLLLSIALLLLVGLVAWCDSAPISQFGNGQAKHQISVAIDFLDQMGSAWATDCRRQLNRGKYHEYDDASAMTNWGNDIFLPRGLLYPNVPDPAAGKMTKARWNRVNCDHFKHIARLAVTLVHEQYHTTQSLSYRTKENVNCLCGGNNDAERDAWSVAMAELDRWIRKYERERKASKVLDPKKLREEQELIQLKLDMIHDYEVENEPDYGPLKWEVILKAGEEEPGDPVPGDPEDVIRRDLEERLDEVTRLLGEAQRLELSGAGPTPAKEVEAPPKQWIEERVPHTPGSGVEDTKVSWSFQTGGQGRASFATVTCENTSQQEIPAQVTQGQVVQVGEQAVPLMVTETRQQKLPPGQSCTFTVPLHQLNLQPLPRAGSPVTTLVQHEAWKPHIAVVLAADKQPLQGIQKECVVQAALWKTTHPAIPSEQLSARLAPRLGGKPDAGFWRQVEGLVQAGSKLQLKPLPPSPFQGASPETIECQLVGDGAATESVQVTFRNRTKQPQNFTLKEFTTFEADGRQKMMVLQSKTLQLGPGQSVRSTLRSMCVGERSDSPPTRAAAPYRPRWNPRLASMCQSLLSKASQAQRDGQLARLPYSGPKAVHRVAQLAFWKRTGQLDRTDLRLQLTQQMQAEPTVLTGEQAAEINRGVDELWKAVDLCLK